MSRLNRLERNPNSGMAGRNPPVAAGVPAIPIVPCGPRRSSFGARPVWYALLGLHLLLFPPPTYAYIDPGTGSYIVQVVIAGLLGAVVSLRIYWARIKAFVKGWRPFARKAPAKHE